MAILYDRILPKEKLGRVFVIERPEYFSAD
jgi:hypothetical protein